MVLVSFLEKLGLEGLNYLFRDAQLVSSRRCMETGMTVPLRPAISIPYAQTKTGTCYVQDCKTGALGTIWVRAGAGHRLTGVFGSG